MFSIGIIVANVPEGLLPTVTLAMAMAARRMARRHTLVRHLPSVETLGATVICTDKTGTLTQNQMEVRTIYVPDRFVTVTDATSAGFVSAYRRFFECAYHCHDLKIVRNGTNPQWIGDPMELALVHIAEAAGSRDALPRVDEIPFEPERKRLVTVHGDLREVVLFVKGAPEEIRPRARWVERDGQREPLTPDSQVAFGRVATTMADRGLRVLAFAHRVLPAEYALSNAEQDLVLTALVGFEDPPRPEVHSAIRRCREAGIKVVMVTGDHPHTALAVHLCRSRTSSIVSLPLFSNRLMTAGIVGEILIILLIDYTSAGHALFGTAPIGWSAWLVVLPFAIGMLMLEEGRKFFVRSTRPAFL